MTKPRLGRRGFLGLAIVLALGAIVCGLGGAGNAGWATKPGPLSARGAGGITESIAINGGSIRLANSALAQPILGYAGSDARLGTLLALRSATSLAGAPRPPSGTAVVLLQVEVSGTRVVTFGDVATQAGIHSPLFRDGVDYSIQLYSGGQPVGFLYDAGNASRGIVTFLSPLANLSLSPGVPLIIEVVAGANVTAQAPLSTSAELARSGSSIALPVSGLSGGSIDYTTNDARTGTTVTFATSGSRNLTNAAIPPGRRPTLFVQFWVSGIRPVRFDSSFLSPVPGSTTPAALVIRSPELVPGVGYDGYLFFGGHLFRIGASGLTSPDGSVSIRSPLTGISIVPRMPAVIELVPRGWLGIHLSASAPTPSPLPTKPGVAPWDVADGIPFFQAPPNVKPANKIRKSHFRGARKSYAWRHRGKKRLLYEFSTSIQHVVVVYMENRTPDNLFAGYYSTDVPGRFPTVTYGTMLDLASTTGLTEYHLSNGYDPGHKHQDFVKEVAGEDPDGLCIVGTCSDSTRSAYIYPDEVANYIDLIDKWGYASHVMQSNEGPSFVAHQYAIAGQSGGFTNFPTPLATTIGTPWAFANNPTNVSGSGGSDPSDPDPDAGPGGGSCFATDQAKAVETIDMFLAYPNGLSDFTVTPTPCASNYLTVLDEMQTEFGTPYNEDWQYVASSLRTIWSGPMAIDRFANAYSMGSPSSQPFAVDPDAGQFVYDIS